MGVLIRSCYFLAQSFSAHLCITVTQPNTLLAQITNEYIIMFLNIHFPVGVDE